MTLDPDDPAYDGPATIPLDEVVLFAVPDSVHCEHVRGLLKERGIQWREVDVSEPAMLPRREQMLFGVYLRVPMLCAAGFVMVGYDRSRISEMLDAHEARLKRAAPQPVTGYAGPEA